MSYPKLATKINRPERRATLGMLLVIFAALALQGCSPQTAEKTLPAEIGVEEAAALRDSGAFVLDVREPSEWLENHIPGATLIPLAELDDRLSEVPSDQPVVVVCRSGNRSQAGRDILKKAGFEQATSMAGGMNQWMASGYEWVSGP